MQSSSWKRRSGPAVYLTLLVLHNEFAKHAEDLNGLMCDHETINHQVVHFLFCFSVTEENDAGTFLIDLYDLSGSTALHDCLPVRFAASAK